jgi:3-hydroxyacyl-CoA dehydrogenase / enoyl-CoA hydratase / 3-hydroxybutyryl-CoA epimerase
MSSAAPQTGSTFTLSVDTEKIGRLVFDLPGEKVNKFSASVVAELEAIVNTLSSRTDIRALVVMSGKPDVFIAGADIKEIMAVTTEADALNKAQVGQKLFQRFSELPFPTVAVIDGACLGGGLEFALSCTYRFVSDAEKTSLGLPEVNLGIIPGWGGTQRLPRLIGLPAGVDLVLSGKPVNGPKALKLHLADACCARAFLPDEVPKFVAAILTPEGRGRVLAKRKRGFSWLEMPGGRSLLFSQAHKTVLAKTKGKMPAPLAAIDLIKRTRAMPLAQGLAEEARTFAQLAPTSVSKCLVDVFFASEAIRKDGGAPTPGAFPETSRAGVLGAGVMGGGIAWWFSSNAIPVRLKDISWEAIARGYQCASQYFDQLVKIRKLTTNDLSVRMHRISGGLDYTGFHTVDVVVEAVVEDINVKKKVFAELEGHVRDDTLICSNTSSLSITEMATALRKPERFVGLHFFNPVNRMPLVEVIPGEKTSREAVAQVAALSRKLGKTVVVVKDCPGFLVNRILLPYMNEAAWLLQEGGEVEVIDEAILEFGMPMGPFRLTDEVGIDVGYKVAKILAQGYGERMTVADVLKHIAEDLELKGAKTGEGFYIHDPKRKKEPSINPDVAPFVAGLRKDMSAAAREIAPTEIVDRCMLTMVNEAAKCIEESVVAKPAFLDLAMIMGTGFPPWRGGPLHHANAVGIATVVARLDQLREKHGIRFQCAELLRTMAKNGEKFQFT